MRDPVVLEIVRNAFSTVGEEMGLAVVRSAYSTIIKEAGDASSAIFDAQGRLIAQSQGAPVFHISSLRPSLKEVMKDFPPDTMKDGDVFLCNDPYRGGIHSNDVMLFKPVFFQGRLSFFACALIHVADIGGMSAGGLPATATEMYHEGLILPPIKLYDGGEPNEGLTRIIAANSRTPEKVLGDIRAMLAAANVGAARLLALVHKHGYEELLGISQELMDYSERRTRQEIQRMPPGLYKGSFLIDDDGVEQRPEGFKVQVAIKIEDSTFQADFTGTDRQARGAINSAYSQSMSGVLHALLNHIDPTIPMNEGCYRPLRVIFPEGTLVNPRPPAACNARMATVMAIREAMLQALSQAYPHKAVGASANIHVYTMNGVEGGTGRVWTFMDVPGGGVGARSMKDGVDSGGGAGQSVESYEIEYPVMFQRMEYRQDSGGPGRWRGGLGVRREIKILSHGQVTARIASGSRFPPPGVLGGQPAKGGSWVVNMGTPQEVVLPAKVTNFPLKPGDVLTALASGGGGFGPPWEREPERVLKDVLEHKVSIDTARRDYGVEIDSESMVIDGAQTRRLRAEMAAGMPASP